MSSREACQMSVRFQNRQNGRPWTALVCRSAQEEEDIIFCRAYCWFVSRRSNVMTSATGIVGFNPTLEIDVYLFLWSRQILCDGRSVIQGHLRNVCKIPKHGRLEALPHKSEKASWTSVYSQFIKYFNIMATWGTDPTHSEAHSCL
jgi:hypothetical protein